MEYTLRPDFVFRRNVRVHSNRRGASVQSTTGSRGVCISGSNAGYTMFRNSVKSTGYPLRSPVSPSLSLPCVIVCHHVSTGLYQGRLRLKCDGTRAETRFVFRRNGRVNLNRRRESVQSTTGSRGVRISGSNVGCTINNITAQNK
jgi:hypothetical protein